jgi:hypothetical protein
MSNRTFKLPLPACVATGTLWAANDPFVGKWKLNCLPRHDDDDMFLSVPKEVPNCVVRAPIGSVVDASAVAGV